MKIKYVVLCLFMVCILTGCGEEDWVKEQMDAREVTMLDTPEEFQQAFRNVNEKDSGEWAYRQDNIDKAMELKNKIQQICGKGTKVNFYRSEWEGEFIESERIQIEDLKKYLSDNNYVKKRELDKFGLEISSENYEQLVKDCQALVQLGFDELDGRVEGYVASNGYGFYVPTREEVEENTCDCTMEIHFPAFELFGPSRYFALGDFFKENEMVVQAITCNNGVVDKIRIFFGESGYIYLLLKDDNLFELVIACGEKELADCINSNPSGIAKIIGKACGDDNEAVSFVKEMCNQKDTRKERSGRVGNRTWKMKGQQLVIH